VPEGRKKLANMRCRFTVSEFMATTSRACAGEVRQAGGQILVIGNPWTPRVLMAQYREAGPVVELLVHPRACLERHEAERVAAEEQCWLPSHRADGRNVRGNPPSGSAASRWRAWSRVGFVSHDGTSAERMG
jgi:hypothetical protein